jgi:uncharacterized caspase-like protein
MKVKLIIISIILLLVMVFASGSCGCIFLEKMSTITSPSLKVNDVGSVTYRAVIVGVGDYESVNDLSYTVNDAEDMQNVLLSYSNWNSQNIQLLIDGDASKIGIKSAISTMVESGDENDVYLFFFSGHGSRIPDEDSDEGKGDHYDEVICPWDTTSEIGSVISDDELGIWLSACPGNIVVILDTCMSGGFAKGVEGTVKTVTNPRVSKDAVAKKHFGEGLVERLKQRPISRDLNQAGYVVLMACGEGDYAYEFEALENGVFTYYVVEALGGPADINSNNEVSAEESFHYADPLVFQYYRPAHQNPELWDGYGGELPLVIATISANNIMHVDNIIMKPNSVTHGPNTFINAIATVIIVDADNAAVEGATVSGTWSGATNDSDSGVTDGTGQVSLKSDKVKNPVSGTTFKFTVDNVKKEGWTYDSPTEKPSGSITY